MASDPVARGLALAAGVSVISAEAGFLNIAALQAAVVLSSQSVAHVLCYSTLGDLGGVPMRFKRISAAPTWTAGMSGLAGQGWVRSADRYLPNGTIDATNGGYWKLEGSPVTPQMFGAKGDNVTDDWPALQNALMFCSSSVNGVTGNASRFDCYIQAAQYYCSQTLTMAGTYKVYGDNSGMPGPQGIRTQIRFPMGVAGFTTTTACANGELRGIHFSTTADTLRTLPAVNGVEIRAMMRVENVSANNFSMNGFRFYGVTGITNIDSSQIISCTADYNGCNGFSFEGSDANVLKVTGCSAVGNASYGYMNQGSFTNTFDTCHESYNGTNGAQWNGTSGPFTKFGGSVWMVTPALNTVAYPLAAITQPGTNAAVWTQTNIAPASMAGAPNWVSGANQYMAGGGYCSFAESVFIDCYTEAGAGWNYFTGNATIIGGGVDQGVNTLPVNPEGTACALRANPSGWFMTNTNTISGYTQVTLRAKGDQFGDMLMVLQNRANANGPLFSAQYSTVDLIEFLLQAKTGTPRNFRLENRVGSTFTGVAPEIQFGLPGAPALVCSDNLVYSLKPFKHAPLTVATLPAAAGMAGYSAYVTDGAAALAWGATVTGGGTTPYLVWCNGTNWTVVGK